MNQTRDFFLRCRNCHTKNRIPQNKIGTVAKCGNCQTVIETGELLQSAPIMVTDANFRGDGFTVVPANFTGLLGHLVQRLRHAFAGAGNNGSRL